jgi:hypothetical protein
MLIQSQRVATFCKLGILYTPAHADARLPSTIEFAALYKSRRTTCVERTTSESSLGSGPATVASFVKLKAIADQVANEQFDI